MPQIYYECKHLTGILFLSIVIDWEAAGFVNPLQELVEVGLAWAGIETDKFNLENFKSVIESYVESGGIIEGDVSAVLSFG